MCDLINRREYKRELRTIDQRNLVVPLVTQKHSGDRFFSYDDHPPPPPRELNMLELSIRKSASLESFKEKIKTCLFEAAYIKHVLHLACCRHVNYIIRVSYCILYRVNYISYLYLRYFIHRMNFMLYMYFCDSTCICFYVHYVEHFMAIGL